MNGNEDFSGSDEPTENVASGLNFTSLVDF